MDTLYTFWDNITHYKTESVNFLGLNSATEIGCWLRYWGFDFQAWGFRVLGLGI